MLGSLKSQIVIPGGTRRAIVRSLSRWMRNIFRHHLGAPPWGDTQPRLILISAPSFFRSHAPRVHCLPRAFRTARHPHSKWASSWKEVCIRSEISVGLLVLYLLLLLMQILFPSNISVLSVRSKVIQDHGGIFIFTTTKTFYPDNGML